MSRRLIGPAAADRIAGDNLTAMGIGLAVLFTLFSAANYSLLSAPANGQMAVLALSSAVAMMVAVGWVRRHDTTGYAHAWATYGVGIGVLNSAARLWLTGDPAFSSTFALLSVGVGLFYLSLRWAVPLILGIVALWAFLAAPLPGGSDYAFTVVGGALLGVTMVVMRARIYGHLEALRSEAQAKATALGEAESRYQLALTGSNDGLYEWNAGTERITFSPQARALLDAPQGLPDTLGAVAERIHPDDFERVRQTLAAHVDGEDGLIEDEFRIRHADGTHPWVLVRGATLRDPSGRLIRVAGSITDMSRRGVFDPLTGLPNRRLLLDRMGRVVSRRTESDGEGREAVVLFLDLDGFKLINDTMGHETGDRLLCEVAARLSSCVRASDTVARLGGDEFVVLLDRIDVPDGLDIALDRITGRLAEPYSLGGRLVRVAPSIGVVVVTDTYRDADTLLRDADLAMYSAKESSDVVVAFDSEMRSRVAERLELELQLRDALSHQQFTLHFQPIVSLDDGAIQGYEALSRWDHPTEGILPPARFIPVLERTGMIVDLERWVLRTACQEMMARFGAQAHTELPFLSVNVSGKHLSQGELVPAVAAALAETGFPADRLRLELTESAIVDNPRRAAARLGELRALGVRILMDDFGTGHSSLSYLQNLPIDTLKVDRSFIARMTQDGDGAELVRTIIRMTANLGLDVVAEGIETPEQARMLRAMDCQSGQGFLFARPSRLEHQGEGAAQPSGAWSTEHVDAPETEAPDPLAAVASESEGFGSGS